MVELKFEVPDGIGEGLFSELSGEELRVLVQALINAQGDAHFASPWNGRDSIADGVLRNTVQRQLSLCTFLFDAGGDTR